MNVSLRRITRRAVTVLGVMLIVSGPLAVGVTAASATGKAITASTSPPPWEPDANSVGGLTFYNSAGTAITGGNLTDSPIAAYVLGGSTVRSGDTKATLYGYLPIKGQAPDAWSGEQLGSSTTYPNTSAPAPLKTSALPLETGASGDETVAQLEADYPNKDTSSDGYADMYVLRLKTTAPGQAANTTYDSADIQITGSTWSVVYPAPAQTATTTTLATSPASPQKSGTSVTLTATVSPTAPGTVQFETGATDIGTPVTVSGGTASTSTTALPVGAQTLSAVFTPTSGSGFAGSTGTKSFTITAAKLTKTKTKLATSPKSSQVPGTSVTLTATVKPAAATGTVQFKTGSTAIGSPVMVTGGTASTSTTALPTGKDKLSAVFTPTSGSAYGPSTGKKTFTIKAKGKGKK
jgi:hypothetical protein